MTKIEFFLEDESLGIYDCPDNSGHEQRVQVANDNNIIDFDKFILDDGRVTATLCKGKNLYSYGEQVWSWNIKS